MKASGENAMQEKTLQYYRCYAMTVASEIAFPELDRAASPGDDLVIRRGAYNGPTDKSLYRHVTEFSSDRQCLDFPHVARFEIGNGADVTVRQYPGAEEVVLGLPLLGPVMATILHYRGYLVLHGSALIIDGKLTIFLGDRGAGKSTTAGFLVKSGHALYNDDVTAIDTSAPGGPVAHAGYPIIKLGPDVYDHLGGLDGAPLSTGSFPFPKVRVRLNREPVPDKLPVHRVCLLQRGDKASFAPLPELTAINTLIRHSYMLKYGDAPMQNGRSGAHFLQCAALTRSAEVGVLTVPSSLERLGEIDPVLKAG